MKMFTVSKPKGDSDFGKTWEVRNEKTGEAFTIDQYPKRDRMGRENAKYAVSEKYGEFLAKFRTKKGALDYIKKIGKVV